jgi:DNA-binding transcriptional MerR regulator
VGFSAQFLNPSAAARQLGVSAKALRLYEQRGLVAPGRTAAGWRVYGPDEMARAAEIVALRGLGLSLSQIARVLGDDPQGLERQGLERQGLERQGLSAQGLEPALAAHQTMLEGRIRQLAGAVEKVRELRAGLAQGRAPTARELARLLGAPAEISVAFDLPWPWGGERFELRDVRPLNYIIGPLGSGKTRLAKRLAETLPDAAFLGVDRLEHDASAARAQLDADPALESRVDRALAWLVEDGASTSAAMVALLVGLESEGAAVLVVDMVEQGLDQGTQEALIAHLRRRGPGGRPLFLLTRSCAILDLAAVGAEEAIILCPANHSPPTRVAPYPGAPGYEAVATCLALPEVRARTEGLIAWRPQVV